MSQDSDLRTSAAAPQPAPQAYDPIRAETVLFGGQDGTQDRADTWRWNGTTWTQAAPATSPPQRAPGAPRAFGARLRRPTGRSDITTHSNDAARNSRDDCPLI